MPLWEDLATLVTIMLLGRIAMADAHRRREVERRSSRCAAVAVSASSRRSGERQQSEEKKANPQKLRRHRGDVERDA
jgi:hypothetical protein